MFIPDNPIKSKSDDKLKRSPLAKEVARMILNYNQSESFVIGIEGEWGAGKTSFINMVLEELSDDVYHFVFNPWNFNDQSSLIRDFFNSLTNTLPNIGKIKKRLKKYATIISGYGFQGINVVGLSWNPVNRFTNQSLESLREDLNKYLLSINKKLIVVVDDIDRLDSDETYLMFKLVKLTANFPNTIFILAYDREKIEKKIDKQEVSGSEYIKKIIQVSFSLPKPEDIHLNEILVTDLNNTFVDKFQFGETEQNRLANLYQAGLKNLFPTIRDVKRYISSLRLDLSVISNEDINPIDFIGIEAMRVFSPQFYNAIAANKELFTSTRNIHFGLGAKDDRDLRKSKYKELLELVPANNQDTIDSICKQLFPQIDFSMQYGSDWQPIWTKELRVCSTDKFDFYFKFGIPHGSLSEVEIKSLLNTLKNGDDFISNLKKYNKENKLRTVLRKLYDNLDSIDDRRLFVLCLWKILDEEEDKSSGVLDIGNLDALVIALTKEMIKRQNAEMKKEFVLDLLRSTDTLYPPTRLVAIFMNNMKKENRTDKDIKFSENDVLEMKGIVLDKIRAAAKQDILHHNQHLRVILILWKHMAGGDEVKKYIGNLIRDKDNILVFLSSFVSDYYSHSMGDYISKKERKFDRSGIQDLYGIEEIEKIVNEISDAELKDMPENYREAIELFQRNTQEDEY